MSTFKATRGARSKRLPFSSSGGHVPRESTFTEIGAAKDVLLPELESYYWDGVKCELENILHTLKDWQRSEFANITIDDDDDDDGKEVYGYDAFINQVGEETTAYAEFAKFQMNDDAEPGDHSSLSDYGDQLETERDVSTGNIRAQVKKEIDGILSFAGFDGTVLTFQKGIPRLQGLQQQAWVLLQAAGLLDIEKLIEHRPPSKELGFWKRPAIPQLTSLELDVQGIPKFQPLECGQSGCEATICGSMFVDPTNKLPILCESCYRLSGHRSQTHVKAHKECILPKAITPEVAANACSCETIREEVKAGMSLFPVKRNNHHHSEKDYQCSLLRLRETVALAKYQGLIAIGGLNNPNPLTKWTEYLRKSAFGKHASYLRRNIKMGAEDAKAQSIAQHDTDIPVFFRRYAERYPFGNVHMALRIGPLVIENGIPDSKQGARISFREMPNFSRRRSSQIKRDNSLIVDGSSKRGLWSKTEPNISPKRYKAIMKQVIGVPFSGVLSRDAELEIVSDMIAASQKPFDNESLPASHQKQILNSILDPIVEKVRRLLYSRVRAYLGTITQRLIDPTTNITWNVIDNNCQIFCNTLLETGQFADLFNGQKIISEPLYVMSFVCPDKGYIKRDVATKFDAPQGIIEEYLLKFRFGRHHEADIIDTCQEYWYDWGAFGGPLYKYQDMFPWDCTEAYKHEGVRCGECNLAKHLLAFPFDSWSIISMHLTREPAMYAPATVAMDKTATGPSASPQSWMRNRLQVLAASSTLFRVATAMSRSSLLCKSTKWLSTEESSLSRRKLGGIHRAQPFSHYYESGEGTDYWIAPWALWTREEKVEEYEKLRDHRATLGDVQESTRSGGYSKQPKLHLGLRRQTAPHGSATGTSRTHLSTSPDAYPAGGVDDFNYPQGYEGPSDPSCNENHGQDTCLSDLLVGYGESHFDASKYSNIESVPAAPTGDGFVHLFHSSLHGEPGSGGFSHPFHVLSHQFDQLTSSMDPGGFVHELGHALHSSDTGGGDSSGGGCSGGGSAE